jgi:phosphatidylethanolamine/phosphatidyl-N-methylethanolamine N-methyltransferase
LTVAPKKVAKKSKLFFLKQYLRKPFGTGSITPSSQKLAELMIASLNLEPGDVVVELGPGTGVFTREILARGVKPANLILIEFNKDFAKYLREEFPKVRIVEGDAGELPKLLQPLGQGRVRRIVSGIPLRSLKPAQRKQITQAIAQTLEPGGVAVQFSYLNASPLPKPIATEAGLIGKRVAVAIGNVPPAFVWQYTKAV